MRQLWNFIKLVMFGAVRAVSLAACIGISLWTVNVHAATSGDVCGDAKVDISDALCTLRYVVELIPHNTANDAIYLAADVAPLDAVSRMPKGNAKVDIADALGLLRHVVNLDTWSNTEFPIAATAGREFSISAAFDGTNYLVGIQGDQISGNNVTAQLVSGSTGSLVGSRISVGRTGGAPFVAFDGTNYLMVLSDDATFPNFILYGQRISQTGQLIGSAFSIAQLGTHGAGPVIFDGSNYFTVWEVRSDPNSGDTADLSGQFISPSGTLVGPAIPISTALHGQREPALTFDGTNILVVWQDGRNQSACYTDPQGTHCFESDVYGQFITKSTANAAGALSSSNFLINASSLPRDNPLSLAFDGTNYFVVFNEETTLPNACPASGCKWDIYGQFVTKAGVPTGSKITISNTAPDHHFPGVVWNGTKYLTAWIESFGTPTTSVKGRYFDTSGAPIGSQLSLFSTGNDGRIPLAFPIVNGSNYFAIVNRGIPGTEPFNFDAYTSQDVLGAFITP